MSFTKAEASSETHSFSAPPTSEHPAMRQPSPSSFKSKSQLITSLHLGLTVLSLLSALTIVGTSASTLEVYNTTRLGKGHFLSIWPNEFDIRPTVALVTCGTIILVSSVLGLIVAKIPAIKNHPFLSTPLSLLFPTTSLIAALISTSFFYGVNASSTTFSLQSWSCQWEDVRMDVKPHWGTLCGGVGDGGVGDAW
ncbi:hypothetical protein EG329_004956 [Mollisiaceae sp. DMI_Dod_QoI]|nr:hypothetical protein EG329_004956 [Helotiales sp. DMI_Dod_QoI]